MAHQRHSNWQGYDRPVWVGDHRSRRTILPGGATITVGAFSSKAGFLIAVAAGGAAVDAEEVGLAQPLEDDVLAGVTLRFESGETATLVEPARRGESTLKVQPLDVALAAGDQARYNPSGRLYIPAGTALGRTTEEMETDQPFGPADAANDDEIFLLAIDKVNAFDNPRVELLRHGTLIYFNHMPMWDEFSDAMKTKIRDLYTVQKGVE